MKSQDKQINTLARISSISKYNVEYAFPQSGQGQVYLCSSQKQLFAVKIPLRLKITSVDKFVKESLFIKNLSHPNIVRLVELQNNAEVICQDKSKMYCPMSVTEFAQEGDLFDYNLKRAYSQEVCRKVFGQIIDAVAYLHHEKKIMHLDLKVDNILVTKEFHFKVTDFGHAKTYQEIQNMTQEFSYGTDWYSPPQYGDFSQFSGQKVDVFNCGLILFKLVTSTIPARKTPFIRYDDLYCKLKQNKYESFWHIMRKRIPKIQLSKSIQRILLCMLQPNPKKRYNLQQIKQDDWFQNTKQATQQKVVEQFMRQKGILLNDSNTKNKKEKLEQIKMFYEKLNNEKQQQFNEDNNKRGNKVDFLSQYYKQLSSQTTSFKKVPQSSIYGVNYCSYKPEFIIIYLKNQLWKYCNDSVILFDQTFGSCIPIQYHLEIKDLNQGIFKITFLYQLPNETDDLENLKQPVQQKNDKMQQQQHDEIRIQVYGQIVKNIDKYGVRWDLKQNNQDCWTKQTIFQLKNMLWFLGQKPEQNDTL